VTEIRALVDDAINVLCTRFEQGGYNPTPIIDLGVLVARADGKVDDAEKKALRDVFESLLDERLSGAVVGHLIAASLEVIELAGAEPRARLVAEILKDCDAVEQGIVVALGIAFASEGLSKAERSVIRTIADAAGLPAARVDALAAEVKAKLVSDGGDGGPENARDSLHGPAARRSSVP
jgi:tellurite resistance protein